MRNIRWLSILLAAALLLSACGSREIPQEAGGFRLWFAADEGQANYGHGPALDSEAYAGVDDPRSCCPPCWPAPPWRVSAPPSPAGLPCGS